MIALSKDPSLFVVRNIPNMGPLNQPNTKTKLPNPKHITIPARVPGRVGATPKPQKVNMLAPNRRTCMRSDKYKSMFLS